ncbi:protein Jade-1 [Juglans microcarpa x Juglans regia]|uniref:protein Jade-1 n=1 Tax=Juglans microcarpa x Juglans regia TaxID=2249226 RepID=UPI001B7E0BBF|nr:protein Jade-1 [Juglans microcarpa x Juglans regia]
MESKFQGLPPLKRFRLMQLQEEGRQHQLQQGDTAVFASLLPAKKRKESRDSPLFFAEHVAATNSPSTYSLPAKKRVWALQPDFIPDKPFSPPFDLNVEYKQGLAFEEEAEEVKKEGTPLVNVTDQSLPNTSQKENEDAAAAVDAVNDGCGGDDDDDGIICAICQSTDGDPSDPIVLCDGCDLMVHASCYGNPLVKSIPEGDWFCAQCLISSSETEKYEKSSSCCLCPTNGGASKPTVDGRWAHIVCALLVPEAFFRDAEGREEIDCSKVPKKRWEDKCYLCMSTSGCAVQCSEPSCPLAFHVTCGLKEDLCIEYREGRKRGAIVAGFCKNHTELWRKQQQTGKFKIVAREEHK